MKKMMIISFLVIGLASCNNNAGDNTHDGADSGGLTNPTAIDTTKHPSGMENSSVISTDTAAMNVQKSIDKAKAADKKKQ